MVVAMGILMLQKDCIIFLLVSGQYKKTQITIVSPVWNIILNFFKKPAILIYENLYFNNILFGFW